VDAPRNLLFSLDWTFKSPLLPVRVRSFRSSPTPASHRLHTNTCLYASPDLVEFYALSFFLHASSLNFPRIRASLDELRAPLSRAEPFEKMTSIATTRRRKPDASIAFTASMRSLRSPVALARVSRISNRGWGRLEFAVSRRKHRADAISNRGSNRRFQEPANRVKFPQTSVQSSLVRALPAPRSRA